MLDLPSRTALLSTLNDEAVRALEAQLVRGTEPESAPLPPPAPQYHGPRIVPYVSKWRRFIGLGKSGGCQGCGQGESPGWVQRQIATPYRFKRSLLWFANLAPRVVSFARTVASRRVDADAKAARDGACESCPHAELQVRERRGDVERKLYCGQCGCPRWRMSETAVKNRFSAHNCPLPANSPGRRADVWGDPDAKLREWAAEYKAARIESNGRSLSIIGGGNGD